VLLREAFPDEGADIAGDVYTTLHWFSDEGTIEFI